MLSQVLEKAGAVLKRRNKHAVYELPNGNKVTVSATPSDHRAELNAIADVRRAVGMVTESKIPTTFKNEKRERKPGRKDPPPVFTGSSALAVALSKSGVVEEQLRQEVARLRAELERASGDSVSGEECEMGINAEIVTITPEWARQTLEEQAALEETSVVKQRRLDKNRVGQYAAEMRSGGWMLNGEGIQFNGARLLNGQHRLAAVVEANTPVQMLVVRGVDPKAFSTIDQGKSRTIGDLLKMQGLMYSSELAGGARVAWLYERTGRLRPTLGTRPTRHQVFDYISKYEQPLLDAARLAVAAGIGHRAVLTGLAFMIRHHDERATFFQRLGEGVDLGREEPVRLLRDRLIAFNVQRATTDQDVVFALCVKAWNATYRRQPIGILRFGRKEDYPVLLQ